MDKFGSRDGRPYLGGAPTPDCDDIEDDLAEQDYRERLRRRGKLPPERNAVDDFRQRIEDLGERFVRIAN
jgi:hypothetical protein